MATGVQARSGRESVPEHRDASSSSQELPSEPRAKVVSGKHSIFFYFTKDRNCHICMRTKITRSSCRKRTGTVVPRADNFVDLTTADHKVLSEGCESRHNHRYIVVVQNLATQWIQSYPCKTNLLRIHRRAWKSSWIRQGNQKSIFIDNSLEFGLSCEDSSWNHCTSTPHRSETNGIAERAVRRIKEGTSAVRSG